MILIPKSGGQEKLRAKKAERRALRKQCVAEEPLTSDKDVFATASKVEEGAAGSAKSAETAV